MGLNSINPNININFEFFEYFAKEHNRELIVVNQPSLSPQEEMVEDMLSIVDTFSSRLYGLKTHKKRDKRDYQWLNTSLLELTILKF